MKYDPSSIEPKWQKFWLQHKTFQSVLDAASPKYYVLDMFPYPSGSGLHVGHLVGYTATDVIARFKRAKGFSVLHPMGWDSFGLPAEQYAIRTGTHPAITTHANIKTFKRQLQALGYAYDWDREIATSEPDYYKWTQWLFTKLYEKGLAYQADMLVNYCPALGTVLANEEVEDGRSKEGGHPIERRPLRQWVLKITAYAERLLEDLESLDWPEGLKKLQRNWIGKSEGALISFQVEANSEKLCVFTTAAHTLFGVTYLVMAPEHPSVTALTTTEQKDAVTRYQHEVATKSDLERTELAKHKSGVFTGSYVLHPVTGKKIPVWIADYVLMGYGTGVVMGVPAHDERDMEFAQKFCLPIQKVIHEEQIVNSQGNGLSLDGLQMNEAKQRAIGWLEQNHKGQKSTSYKLRDWLFSRQRYWGEPFPLLHLSDGSIRILELDELPLVPPEVIEYKPTETGESPLAKVKDWVEITDPKTGLSAKRETHTMPQWAGSCWYYLRFCDPTNTQAPWGQSVERYWMPVDLYIGGAEHAVLHLLYARFWHKVFYDCGLVHTQEPFQALRNQGLVVSRAYQKASGTYVSEEEVVEKEGVYRHWETGEVLRSQIEKMSKSKLNGVSPDEIIEEFGADALRLYALFMGPLEKEKVWNLEGVQGCRRFLNRFCEMVTSAKVCDQDTKEGLRLAHCLVQGVGHDIEKLLFNTAISKMMEFVNEMTKLDSYPVQAVKMAVQALAPLAPHLAEELWHGLGHEGSVCCAPWPQIEECYLQQDQVTYVIQVNGKVRGRFELPKDRSQQEILDYALTQEGITRYVSSPQQIEKVVFVPNKLLNLVMKS
ncbi:MAG: leucine--tRNA ligase [Verrucomicrobia bacterium]|nr:leucine--tRNA ligase [Verrucomicrobiota bacterium]MBS0646461.1 leucine--tRNA ligase [Verrucomicrobiota bacterium]